MRSSRSCGSGSRMLTDPVQQNPCRPPRHCPNPINRPIESGQRKATPPIENISHNPIHPHQIGWTRRGQYSNANDRIWSESVSPLAQRLPNACSPNRRASGGLEAAAQFVSTCRENVQRRRRRSRNIKKPSVSRCLSAVPPSTTTSWIPWHNVCSCPGQPPRLRITGRRSAQRQSGTTSTAPFPPRNPGRVAGPVYRNHSAL